MLTVSFNGVLVIALVAVAVPLVDALVPRLPRPGRGPGGRGRHPDRAGRARLGPPGPVHPGAQRPGPGHAAVPGRPGDRRGTAAGAAGPPRRPGFRRVDPARPGLRLPAQRCRPGHQTGVLDGGAGLDLGWSAPSPAQRRRRAAQHLRAAGHDRRGPGRGGLGAAAVPAVLRHLHDRHRPGELPRHLPRPARGRRPGPRAGPEPGRHRAAARPVGGPQRPAAGPGRPDPGPGLRGARQPVRAGVHPGRLRRRAAGARPST